MKEPRGIGNITREGDILPSSLITVLAVVLMALVMWYGLIIKASAQGYYVDQYTTQLQEIQRTQQQTLDLQRQQQLQQQQMQINRALSSGSNGQMLGNPNGY